MQSPSPLCSFIRMEQKHEYKRIHRGSVSSGPHASQQYSSLNFGIDPMNNPFCCLCSPQAIIPLSYAAQIPTTPDLDLANVRLSVSKVDHQVQYQRVMRALYLACFCARMCEEVCVRDRMCVVCLVRVRVRDCVYATGADKLQVRAQMMFVQCNT